MVVYLVHAKLNEGNIFSNCLHYYKCSKLFCLLKVQLKCFYLVKYIGNGVFSPNQMIMMFLTSATTCLTMCLMMCSILARVQWVALILHEENETQGPCRECLIKVQTSTAPGKSVPNYFHFDWGQRRDPFTQVKSNAPFAQPIWSPFTCLEWEAKSVFEDVTASAILQSLWSL